MFDFKWPDSLKMSPTQMIGAAVATSVLLVVHHQGYLDIPKPEYKEWVRPVLTIATVAFWAFGLGEIVMRPLNERRRTAMLAARREVRRKEEAQIQAEHQATVLARLDHLSKEELAYVADCIRKGTPSFLTYMYHGPVALLCYKGLVATPGGNHHQDHYPFMFLDFVWKDILERSDEFIKKDAEHKKADEVAQLRRRRG